MFSRIFNQKLTLVAIAIFGVFSIGWGYVCLFTDPTQVQLDVIGGTYGLMALYGGIVGLFIAKKWGGYKSLIGRAMIFLSLGLLAQEFGQIVYTYLGTVNDEIPYPSIGDIGYMSSVLLYIAATVTLAKATGSRLGVKSLGSKLQIVAIPVIVLAASYTAFLRSYEFDWSHPLAIFLDFGYPLGQSVYITIAILVFLLSRKLLGGVMRPVILFLLGALCIQYASDYTFLYKSYNDTWTVAGINDYMYLVSYFVMTLALLKFGVVAQKLKLKPVSSTTSTINEDTESKSPEAQS